MLFFSIRIIRIHYFLIQQGIKIFSGAKIDMQDNFGRAPLHVAAAVDYAEMVEYLINKRANINILTLNEQQTPIHFAAKNGACQSLKMLLAYGADIVSKDSKNRTPLQV